MSEGVVVWFVEVVRVINYYVVDKFYLCFVFFVGQDINSKFILNILYILCCGCLQLIFFNCFQFMVIVGDLCVYVVIIMYLCVVDFFFWNYFLLLVLLVIFVVCVVIIICLCFVYFSSLFC